MDGCQRRESLRCGKMSEEQLLKILRYLLLIFGSLCICGYNMNFLGEYNGMCLLMGIILIAHSVSLTVVMCDE